MRRITIALCILLISGLILNIPSLRSTCPCVTLQTSVILQTNLPYVIVENPINSYSTISFASGDRITFDSFTLNASSATNTNLSLARVEYGSNVTIKIDANTLQNTTLWLGVASVGKPFELLGYSGSPFYNAVQKVQQISRLGSGTIQILWFLTPGIMLIGILFIGGTSAFVLIFALTRRRIRG